MREFIQLVAATAAWVGFCVANRLVDCPELRRAHKGELHIRGDSYLLARTLADTLELMALEQARLEQPKVIEFNGRDLRNVAIRSGRR